ncbi:alpha/beta hydrolase [Ramlibacter sp. G-1-2-2]|uniref:Alpha/beta hydrolase n=1 Tax=Ramlibacter agri TaxID=2728837 RepID=A0A848H3D4_9BURK|nr:alpha/beta hydrolase [Ramlibacter agri]NML45476.1 alpha/beta hydrolase [Ramlibacter agri]
MSTWVLLRGLAREARHWGGFARDLQQRLPPGDQVLCVDLPGTGSLWHEPSPASVTGLVQAARRELALLRSRAPYVLVALSLGGMVAREWAGRDPDVAASVLINTSLGGVAPFWQRLRPSSYPALLALARPGLALLPREQRILRLTSNAPAQEEVAQQWTAIAATAPVSRLNVLRQLLAAARYRPDGPARAPTLLLASTRDRLVSVECSRRLARAWNVPLREHPSAGHDLPLDDPQWVADAIIRWHRGLFHAV